MRSEEGILGIKAPVLVSGNLENSPGTILQGTKGAVKLTKGVIIAKMHVHLHTLEAGEFEFKNGDKVDIYFNDKRLIQDVIIRSGDTHKSKPPGNRSTA